MKIDKRILEEIAQIKLLTTAESDMIREWTIVHWKDKIGRIWHQVRYEGRTVEQYMSLADAECYIQTHRRPEMTMQLVNQRKGRVMKRISVYP